MRNTHIVIWIQLKYLIISKKIRAKYLHEHAQHYLTFTKAVQKKTKKLKALMKRNDNLDTER